MNTCFNYMNKPTVCTFCMYLFYNLCTNNANVSRHVCIVCTELQNTVNHELLIKNEMVVRNM